MTQNHPQQKKKLLARKRDIGQTTVNGRISRCLAHALTLLKATRAHRSSLPLRFWVKKNTKKKSGPIGGSGTTPSEGRTGARERDVPQRPKGPNMAYYYYYLTVRSRARGALKSACRGGGSLSRHVLDWACPRQVLGAMAWCAPQCSKPHLLASASAPPRASPPLQLQQRHDRAPVTSTTP